MAGGWASIAVISIAGSEAITGRERDESRNRTASSMVSGESNTIVTISHTYSVTANCSPGSKVGNSAIRR